MAVKKVADNNKAMQYGLIGTSLVGLAAAAYFLLGPRGKQNRQQTKSWAIKMKADVIEGLEKARIVSQPAYDALIDMVAAKYARQMKSSPAEIKSLAKELKSHWETFRASSTNSIKETAAKKPAVTKKPVTAKKKSVVAKKKTAMKRKA
ncbi:MAG: hypothetical protein Q8Q67_01890 [bacterium]|nr:hypothetical protein [bacterium]